MFVSLSEKLHDKLARDPAIRLLEAQAMADRALLHELLNETLARTIASSFAVPYNELPGTIGNSGAALPLEDYAPERDLYDVIRWPQLPDEVVIAVPWKVRWNYGIFPHEPCAL